MTDDFDDTLLENAQGPAKASGDAGSVEQHKLSDLLELARYLASKAATKTRNLGLKFRRFVPPGTQ